MKRHCNITNPRRFISRPIQSFLRPINAPPRFLIMPKSIKRDAKRRHYLDITRLISHFPLTHDLYRTRVIETISEGSSRQPVRYQMNKQISSQLPRLFGEFTQMLSSQSPVPNNHRRSQSREIRHIVEPNTFHSLNSTPISIFTYQIIQIHQRMRRPIPSPIH